MRAADASKCGLLSKTELRLKAPNARLAGKLLLYESADGR